MEFILTPGSCTCPTAPQSCAPSPSPRLWLSIDKTALRCSVSWSQRYIEWKYPVLPRMIVLAEYLALDRRDDPAAAVCVNYRSMNSVSMHFLIHFPAGTLLLQTLLRLSCGGMHDVPYFGLINSQCLGPEQTAIGIKSQPASLSPC